KPRLLHDLPAALDLAHLLVDLVLDGLPHEAEGIDVLQLHARAQLFRAARPHADVRVAAEGAFFEISVVDPEIDQTEAQRLEVLARFFRGAQVGLADDLHQRHAGAVQIDEAAALAVDVLAGVLLEVDALERDGTETGHRHGAAGANR